ncbi:hypothetical protein [Lactovum odontotermitis]
MTNWISNPQFSKFGQEIPSLTEMKKTVAAAQELGFQPLTYDFSVLSDLCEQGDLGSDAALISLPLFFESYFAVLQPQDVLVVQLPLGFSFDNPELELRFLEELKRREIRLVGLMPRFANDFDLANPNHQDFVLNVLSYFEVLITASPELIKLTETSFPELAVIKLEFLDFLASNIASRQKNLKRIFSLGEQAELSEFGLPAEIIDLAELEKKDFIGIGRGFAWLGSSEKAHFDLNLYRFSFYLATGQVLLVSEKSEFASFIEEEGIGLIVRTEAEAGTALQMPEEDYQRYLQRVRLYQTALKNGLSTKQALIKVLQFLHMGSLESAGNAEESSRLAGFKNWLHSKIFYCCSAADYEKFGIWRFEADGKLSGLGADAGKNWRIHHRKLEILDRNGSIVSFFWIPSKMDNQTEMMGFRQLESENEASQLLLIPSSLEEIEALELDSDSDLGNLTSFMTAGSEPYEKLKALTEQNKVIDGSFQHQYFVVPAKDLVLGLPIESGISYQLEPPADKETYLSKKLIVCFSAPEKTEEVNARTRLTSNERTRPLASLIAKNTFILRPVELPAWENNENDEKHETALQKMILKVAGKYEIPKENIILYGYGSSGISTMIHALQGEYPALVFEPETSRKQVLPGEKDTQFSFNRSLEKSQQALRKLLEQTKIQAAGIQIIFSKHSQKLEKMQPNQTSCTIYEAELDESEQQLSPIELTLLNDWLYAADIETLDEKKAEFLRKQYSLDKEAENV